MIAILKLARVVQVIPCVANSDILISSIDELCLAVWEPAQRVNIIIDLLELMLRFKDYIRSLFLLKLGDCIFRDLTYNLIFPHLVVVRIHCSIDIPNQQTGLIPTLMRYYNKVN